MFVHCVDCDWEQDDFWSKDYNPLKSLLDWEENLLDFEKLDEPSGITDNAGRPLGTWRELIAGELMLAAQNVLGQTFLTPGVAREARCPMCDGKLVED